MKTTIQPSKAAEQQYVAPCIEIIQLKIEQGIFGGSGNLPGPGDGGDAF